ncbi:MAG: ABC transporter permease [Gaiellales bacterium]
MKRLTGDFQYVVAMLALLLIWQLASVLRFVDPNFFPPPTEVFATLWEMLVSGALWPDTWVTLQRVALSFLIGVVPGVALGLLMGWVRLARLVLDPVITVIYPIPRIAILPLFLVILGLGSAPVIAITALIGFFPAAMTTYTGVSGLDKNLPLMAKNLGAGWWQVMLRIAVPSSLPVMLAGLRLALGVALTGLVAAEFVASQEGLGAQIWRFWQLYRLTEMWAYILVVSFIGIVLQFGLIALQRKLLAWEEEVDLLR